MINKTEIRARICDNFRVRWLGCITDAEHCSYETATRNYGNDDTLDKLSNRISGKIVTLIKFEYTDMITDYFEKIDNNFVIFPSLFEVVSDDEY